MIMAISKRLKNNKGFTLVELIVVIAVLGILAAIAVPRLTGVKEDAAWKADIATAANLGKAAEMYVQMNDVEDDTDIVEELKKNNYISSEPKTDLYSQYLDKDDAYKISVSGGKVTVNYRSGYDRNKTELYPEPGAKPSKSE